MAILRTVPGWSRGGSSLESPPAGRRRLAGGDVPALPLWQKAAYFLAGGIGMVLVSRVMTARSQPPARTTARKQQGMTNR